MSRSHWVEGLGSVLKQAIRNPAFDPPAQPEFGPDHHALWNRVGRQTSVLELVTSCSLPADRAIAVLRDLDRWNALILVDSGEGDDDADIDPTPDPLVEPSADEALLLAEPVDLDDAHKQRLLALVRMLRQGRHHEMLGVAPAAGTRELKRAYYALSKEVHPDRFYGKRLGSFQPIVTMIFEAACQAVKTLSDPRTVAGAAPVVARRRASPRYPYTTPVTVRCASWSSPLELATTDVSAGGLFVATERPAHAGEPVEVALGAELRLAGTVVGQVPARERAAAGLCIRLAPMGAAERTRFDRVVRAARDAAPTPAAEEQADAGALRPARRSSFARGSQEVRALTPVIGIDFGTTYLSVSASAGDRVHVLPWPDGSLQVPSVVAFPARQPVLVGAAARDRLLRDPRHTVAGVKRLLGRQAGDREVEAYLAQASYSTSTAPDGNLAIELGDQTLAVPQVCAHLLAAARESAERGLGQAVRQAVLTVPVNFPPARVDLLRRACKLAQLDAVELIDEPTAAALANRFHPDFGGVVGIYDFGGGTFDFSVVNVSAGDFKVLATAGDSWLGGDDLDLAVAEAVANQFWRLHGIDLRQRAVEWQELRFACERAKRELSTGDAATLFIPGVAQTARGAIDLKARVARSLAERLWQPIIDRTFHTSLQTLALAGLRPGELRAIYLSGGSTYVPAVRAGLSQRFGVPVRTGVPPDHAVCLGAGIHAAQLSMRRATSAPLHG